MKGNIIAMAAVAVVTAIVVLASVAIGVGLAGGGGSVQTASTGAPAAAVAEPPVVEVPKTISIPGYAQLVMKAGEVSQTVALHNPAENPCYFVITIALPDGTGIYRSGMIEPGQKTSEIKLSQPVAAGTYKEAILRYACYSVKDKTPMNGAETKFTLEVVE